MWHSRAAFKYTCEKNEREHPVVIHTQKPHLKAHSSFDIHSFYSQHTWDDIQLMFGAHYHNVILILMHALVEVFLYLSLSLSFT